jgi:hypothetical protein
VSASLHASARWAASTPSSKSWSPSAASWCSTTLDGVERLRRRRCRRSPCSGSMAGRSPRSSSTGCARSPRTGVVELARQVGKPSWGQGHTS